ncbi:dihydrofolate reductase [Aquaticitalea lipolytica]|uniref:dihydrofolate reductase n=1 Tax=Aquaticitalea lipolytica TaxID=1247562 RepID=UPI0024BBA5C4|nr:dihydrofolate reductase [Aquaticitalea lipolytica]
MFGKKKAVPQIDKEQLELIKTAQARVKQKKRLYIHFVVFLIGAVFLIILNTVIGVGEDVTLFGKNWFVFAILAWLFLFVYHLFNVFITHKFMGKDWEQQQLDKLVAKQKERITQLEKTITKQDTTTSKLESEEEKKTKISTGLTIIVAAGENDAIGKDNKLIWHLSDDLKRFKALTSGHNIIMGRKTFESFPKPLPNRTHVVISRQKDYQAPEGIIIVNSLENAINATRQDKQSFVIGGGEIYKQAILLADKIEMTRVHESFDADTFFPKIDPTIWKEVSNTFHNKDENHEHSFSFITYERR